MPRTFVLLSAVATCAPTFVPAQVPAARAAEAKAQVLAQEQASAADAIRQWVDDFSSGRLAPKSGLLPGALPQPRYMGQARWAGVLQDDDIGRLTHLDMLQKLLFFAEQHPSIALADSVLDVAAAGLDRTLLDRDVVELRELGHWTLMRMADQGIWFLILRAAAGERVPVFDRLRPDPEPPQEAVSVGPARRAAALRLLGHRALPVFRSTLEAGLVDPDARVRLAAAESIRMPWRLQTVQRVARALAGERHPVVSQALVRLLLKMLQRPPAGLDQELQGELVHGALAQIGRAGWRTDMDLLDLVEAFPAKDAIPHLINALDLELKSPDALVSAINRRASPLLRERAGGLLRAMTGALVPIEDPQAWRDFWQQEQDHIVVPERLPRPDPNGTRVTFFGVPVTGGSIAFLVDTSGSMEAAAANQAPLTGPRRRARPTTRLVAAREQLLVSTQAMAPGTQYHLMTFADEVRAWSEQPIRPSRRNTRSVTWLLGRLNAHGGTNLFAGLVAALEMERRTVGGANFPKIDELFVLSDGEPTSGEVQDTDTLCELVREANKYAKVRIHAVFTGVGKGSALLRRLAAENGGVFVQR